MSALYKLWKKNRGKNGNWRENIKKNSTEISGVICGMLGVWGCFESEVKVSFKVLCLIY